MNAREYQKAAKETALYPREQADMYLYLGAIGEIGEFANQYKKMLRDDGGITYPERREKLLDELADVCWYVAMIATEAGNALEFPEDIGEQPDRMDSALDSLLAALSVAGWYLGDKYGEMESVLYHLEGIAFMLESHVQDLFDRNIAKLRDRKNRGTLHGSGDNR